MRKPTEIQATEETDPEILELLDTEDKIALPFQGHLFIQQMLIEHLLGVQSSSRHYKFSGR